MSPPLIGGGIKRCLYLTSDVCLTSELCVWRLSRTEQRDPGKPKLVQK